MQSQCRKVLPLLTALLLVSFGNATLADDRAKPKKGNRGSNDSEQAAVRAHATKTEDAKKATIPPTQADGGDSLRQAAQNPVADLISVPFQNNTSFGFGPYGKPQHVLNIQPVVPIRLTDDWNLITRWVTPIVSQPQLTPTGEREFGLGNIQPSFFLSPARPGQVIWGVGAVLWLPTATDSTLGLNKWGGGPTAVALTAQGPWVIGALINNVWAGSGDRRINQMLLQPFINYNLPNGWYLVSSPVITANWRAPSGEKWTVPVGGGFGRLFRIGSQPINLSVQAFYNVIKPTFGADWSARLQLQLLFPAR